MHDHMNTISTLGNLTGPALSSSMSARIILLIVATEGPKNMNELARLSGITPAGMTGLIDRLEAVELVRRKPGSDRRSTRIEATDIGERAVQAAVS